MALLHEGDLRDAMQLTRPAVSGAVALGDAVLLQVALTAIADCLGVAPSRRLTSVVPAIEVVASLRSAPTRATVQSLLARAGFPDPELGTAQLIPALDQVGRYINGILRHRQGVARRRLLTTLGQRAQPLRSGLRRLSAEASKRLPTTLGEVMVQTQFTLSTSTDPATPFLEGLDRLLANFTAGVAAMLEQVEDREVGRPAMSDCLYMAAEQWLAVWRRLHPTVPTSSRKGHGYVPVGTDMILLAMRANGRPGLSLAQRSTIEAALIDQLVPATG